MDFYFIFKCTIEEKIRKPAFCPTRGGQRPKNLKTALFKGKAILLIGPRQVGKTTLLHFIANEYKKPYLWLNADESDIALKLENTTSTELKALIGQNKLVIVDEAQVIKTCAFLIYLYFRK